MRYLFRLAASFLMTVPAAAAAQTASETPTPPAERAAIENYQPGASQQPVGYDFQYGAWNTNPGFPSEIEQLRAYLVAAARTQDYARAREYAVTLVERGNPVAMRTLAEMHARGLGGPVDDRAAAQMFRAAADFGDRTSALVLGMLYRHGLGVEASTEESRRWLAIAARSNAATTVGQTARRLLRNQGN